MLSSFDWLEITEFLTSRKERECRLIRNTKETQISLHLNLDGNGKHSMDTGLKFYDHMLDQLAKHSGVDLTIHVKGDLAFQL